MVLFSFTGLLAMHNSHINTKLSGSLLRYFWDTLERVLMMLLLLEPRVTSSSMEEEKEIKDDEREPAASRACLDVKKSDETIHRDEVEVVMKSLGLACGRDSVEGTNEWVDCNDLSQLFEEKEPSLEELREAFDVFDENKDGFIDALELQRVLCLLGLTEGLELENCKRMIKHFDQDGDERVDFFEFTIFMETSFC